MSLTDKAKDKAKKNPTWLLGVLLLLHLFVISLNRVPGQPSLRYLQLVTMSGMMPFQWVATRSVDVVKGVWNGYFRLRDSTAENERLKNERAQLETKIVELRGKAQLFDQLNTLKDWQAANSYPGVTARVISRDANQWFNTVTIDQGMLAGISKDQPVVTADGLVGRVVEGDQDDLAPDGEARVVHEGLQAVRQQAELGLGAEDVGATALDAGVGFGDLGLIGVDAGSLLELIADALAAIEQALEDAQVGVGLGEAPVGSFGVGERADHVTPKGLDGLAFLAAGEADFLLVEVRAEVSQEGLVPLEDEGGL